MMNYAKTSNGCVLTICVLTVETSGINVFTNKNIEVMPVTKVNNINLSFSSETKILGVNIDNKLLFAKQISNLCSKISSNIQLLKRLEHFLPLTIIKKLYYTIVHPHITYGIEVWGISCRTQLAGLRRLIDKCLKILT